MPRTATITSCTLDALVAMGPNARAVVVVNDTVTDAELRRMHAMGAHGIRFTRLAHPDQRLRGQDHGSHAASRAGIKSLPHTHRSGAALA